MSQLAHDLRAAIRNIRRRPLIPIVVVTILALGLAACIAVFTYINGFQQSFPGVEARPAWYGSSRSTSEEPYQDISYLDFLDYAEANGSARRCVRGAGCGAGLLRGQRAPRHGDREWLSSKQFRATTFGCSRSKWVSGRGLQPDDDRPGADPVAVLSHSLVAAQLRRRDPR